LIGPENFEREIGQARKNDAKHNYRFPISKQCLQYNKG
jgi:hypothetical protein